jgi:hypothetical protein
MAAKVDPWNSFLNISDLKSDSYFHCGSALEILPELFRQNFMGSKI